MSLSPWAQDRHGPGLTSPGPLGPNQQWGTTGLSPPLAGRSGGNNPVYCHLNASAMRCEILCFQNLLSALPLSSRAGCIEQTRGNWCDSCDMSYDRLVAPWQGGHGRRDLSPRREPSTGFIRLKTVMNIFPSPVFINNGPLLSFCHTYHSFKKLIRDRRENGSPWRAVPLPWPRLLHAGAGRGRSGLAESGVVAGAGQLS